jgi:hypothetical protein
METHGFSPVNEIICRIEIGDSDQFATLPYGIEIESYFIILTWRLA